ncbi:MAG: hypothetical protein CMC81_02190 [Flavobacteriaceae bacterium]|nr:hypothetical protein [Flavobacteriaceae bacterium]|tara:strand:- start:1034 stop:1708 length:675 start_codon:yes stop_codon:yes gene_type:complete
MKNKNIDNIFIYWIYFVSLILIFLYVIESFGLISRILRDDISYISSLISIIFLFYIIIGGYHLHKLRDALYFLDSNKENATDNIFITIYNDFFKASYIKNNESKTSPLYLSKIQSVQDNFKTRMYEFVDNSFFIADLLLKLGIVGTVIGFIIMLSSLATIDEMNLSKMNNLLLSMSGGMKVALYTTLSGLIGSILITIQSNFLENKINIFINKALNTKLNEKKK